MNLETAEGILHRYLITSKPLDQAPRVVRRALDVIDRKKEAAAPNTPADRYQLNLLVYDELIAKAGAYQKRAKVRQLLADYMHDVVLPEHFDVRIFTAADKLAAARHAGTWGRHADGSLVTIWDDKSGLSKLDPDEAREESQRLAERYGAHVLKLAQEGRGLHYLVMTIPNVAAGGLAKAQKDLCKKWVNFKRIQRDKNKAFPEIVGDLVIVESPLAADGRWNVHLNVLLVTQRPFHAGMYERIRREWKFNCFMRPVKGDAGEIARAFNELIKYGARTVPEKSDDKASRHQSDAPAMIEWPASRFVEWFDAQHGFRRTRTYGCLYGKKVPKPEPRSLDDVTWLGAIRLTPDGFRAELPLISLIPGDKSTTRRRDRQTTDPP